MKPVAVSYPIRHCRTCLKQTDCVYRRKLLHEWFWNSKYFDLFCEFDASCPFYSPARDWTWIGVERGVLAYVKHGSRIHVFLKIGDTNVTVILGFFQPTTRGAKFIRIRERTFENIEFAMVLAELWVSKVEKHPSTIVFRNFLLRQRRALMMALRKPGWVSVVGCAKIYLELDEWIRDSNEEAFVYERMRKTVKYLEKLGCLETRKIKNRVYFRCKDEMKCTQRLHLNDLLWGWEICQ